MPFPQDLDTFACKAVIPREERRLGGRLCSSVRSELKRGALRILEFGLVGSSL